MTDRQCDPDDVAKGRGFDSWSEMLDLVCAVEMKVPGMLARLEDWKENDGTKAGLLKLLGRSN